MNPKLKIMNLHMASDTLYMLESILWRAEEPSFMQHLGKNVREQDLHCLLVSMLSAITSIRNSAEANEEIVHGKEKIQNLSSVLNAFRQRGL